MPVAQLDRAFASGAKGRGFESRRAYQILASKHCLMSIRQKTTCQDFCQTDDVWTSLDMENEEAIDYEKGWSKSLKLFSIWEKLNKTYLPKDRI